MIRRSLGSVLVAGVGSVVVGGCALLIGLDEGKDRVNGHDCATNGTKDGDETDVDCGGGCTPCADAKGCGNGADCASHVCIGGTCIAPACDDKVTNGAETDVDCGGSMCLPCGPGKICAGDQDCKNNTCMGGTCLSTCSDKEKGGAETDVDCGGGSVSGCQPCANGNGCKVGDDCQSAVCELTTCADNYVWGKAFSNYGATGTVQPIALAVNASGTAIMGGNLTGATDFGGATFTSAGLEDGFIAAFDGSGKHLWSQRFGDADHQRVSGVALNDAGNAALAGRFKGKLYLGLLSNSLGSEDAYVASFDKFGSLAWVKSFGDSGFQEANGVAIDAGGGPVIVGDFTSSIDLGGGALASAGQVDVFVGRFDASGKYVWGKRFGDSNSQNGNAVVLDGSGNVIIAGGFYGTIDFGGGVLTSAGNSDIFVTKFSSAGQTIWSKAFGDSTFQIAELLSTDSAGNILLAGHFFGTIDFGGGPINGNTHSACFLAKLDSSGKHIWSKAFLSTSLMDNPEIRAISADPSGNIVVTGSFTDTIDFGGGVLASSGGTDMFVAKFDAAGKHRWSRRFGEQTSQTVACVAVYDSMNIAVAGESAAAIDLGGGPLPTKGYGGAFLAKLLMP